MACGCGYWVCLDGADCGCGLWVWDVGMASGCGLWVWAVGVACGCGLWVWPVGVVKLLSKLHMDLICNLSTSHLRTGVNPMKVWSVVRSIIFTPA